jgi:hypothetical protein
MLRMKSKRAREVVYGRNGVPLLMAAFKCVERTVIAECEVATGFRLFSS